MAHSSEVQKLIAGLGLLEHPEGGWYKETYRSPLKIQTAQIRSHGVLAAADQGTSCASGERNLATLIYYLLPQGVESRVHRVAWDEVWLWQGGGVLDVRSYEPGAGHVAGAHTSHLLGHGSQKTPQLLMPAGTWFNAVVAEGDYVLAACMVAPGFDFIDLTML